MHAFCVMNVHTAVAGLAETRSLQLAGTHLKVFARHAREARVGSGQFLGASLMAIKCKPASTCTDTSL